MVGLRRAPYAKLTNLSSIVLNYVYGRSLRHTPRYYSSLGLYKTRVKTAKGKAPNAPVVPFKEEPVVHLSEENIYPSREKGSNPMVQRVFVLDTHRKPLSPCHPARARELLRRGKAAVFRRVPFTIILKYVPEGEPTPVWVKLDPGSRTTGIALTMRRHSKDEVVWAAELEHKGLEVKAKLDKRRAVRRNRRGRKTRYRPARFLNRRRKEGWLPPSIESRVGNVVSWINRFRRWAFVGGIAMELVKFDTQAMQNPEISGTEYQRGTLFGYEVREYLLEKWERRCAYCGAENVPLEIDHIVPRSRGGSDSVSNLTLACHNCNQKKGNRPVEEFLRRKPEVLEKVLAQAKAPLRDAAAVNATRFALLERLRAMGLPVECGTGGRTKYNRTAQNYPKAHWIDAACVGESGSAVRLTASMGILSIKAVGRGSRQMCRMDRYGFPRTGPKVARTVHGFRTGDLVRAVVPKGRSAGTHTGYAAVRASGSFRIGNADGVSWRHCRLLQRGDGYRYNVSSSSNV